MVTKNGLFRTKRIMVSRGMVSKSKYWIYEKTRVTSSQKRRKKPYAQVMVFSQGPLETILHVPKFFAQNLVTFLSFLNMRG